VGIRDNLKTHRGLGAGCRSYDTCIAGLLRLTTRLVMTHSDASPIPARPAIMGPTGGGVGVQGWGCRSQSKFFGIQNYLSKLATISVFVCSSSFILGE